VQKNRNIEKIAF